MKIYIDENYICSAEAADSKREFEVEFFDDKEASLISGYRYVPTGETYTREDGVQFEGEMITPLSLSAYLLATERIAALEALLAELQRQN